MTARQAMLRRNRADSIPEDRAIVNNAEDDSNNNHNIVNNNDNMENESSMEELLLRHSSPLVLASRSGQPGVTSPLTTERNSSPSPLRLNRPRSNPRNRTPNRVVDDEQPQQRPRQQQVAVEERRVVQRQAVTNEGRRITIRPMAGAAVGTNMAGTRIRETARAGGNTATHAPVARSRKQGPSHRKVRRWNNDNFVNLAAEISSGRGSAAAAEALLRGSANASKHRSILDPQQHESKAMTQFREDETLSAVRQQFFEGELPNRVPQPVSNHNNSSFTPEDISSLTPLQRFHRIEGRLRRILTKACENSYAASKVVNILEDYLVRVHAGKKDKHTREEWLELLLEPPTVTSPRLKKSKDQENDTKATLIARFLFDADSDTGGFHRLLLHGICQFHGLHAASSTMQVVVHNNETKKARVLTATGTLYGENVRLVDFIMDRQRQPSSYSGTITTGTYPAKKQEVVVEK
mmetsp:Transcript_12103/g.22502  ORF Transcript_12103/g.22502 Transcript_12103/m.22502 type:complete len:465 (+) Transcript_12103:74-1468(+)|eukprot:CAMPEP_0178746596 /NCGR_PEP_ID=MMETSP0744-20121128/7889_1 /TAXON_ID=913974 /ORGANISM="Nitzschia punctata, Strain CCMP561" /LENGTH=464 /DNA_ID=CAMNT_0020399809 /DNA_START=132 /DNA_END=1526 /DNA_ORIENTATION=+